MITAFDRIVIDVADLPSAVAEYATLLGPFDIDGDRARLPLANVAIELRENSSATAAGIGKLSLFDGELGEDAEIALPPPNRGLQLCRVGSHSTTSQPTDTGIRAVDHLVLQSRDADDCIRLFGEEGLGMRLALDQEVPEWGGRMVFFRMGKMTLEVIQNLKEPPARDQFWGITYLCDELDTTIAELDNRGVAHSPIREGRKPGTRVATVKSHCLDLPTLLIGPE